MEHHEPSGMFFNWYDPATGATLHTWPEDGSHVEPFVSSVDSGWLGAALLVVKNAGGAAGPARRRAVRPDALGRLLRRRRRSPGHPSSRPGGLMHGGFFPYADGRPVAAFLGTHIGGDPTSG